jgi:hypothetical protein
MPYQPNEWDSFLIFNHLAIQSRFPGVFPVPQSIYPFFSIKPLPFKYLSTEQSGGNPLN